MPYHIRITDDAVYHNGEFIKQNPPELPQYAELLNIIQSNTSPQMDKEPTLLTQDMLETWGMKLFLAIFGSDCPAPEEPILLDIANQMTRMIPFEILHDGNQFLARTVGVARIYPTDKNYEWKPLTKRMSALAAFAGPLMYPHLDDPEHPDQPHPIPVRYAAETFRNAISRADLPAAFTLRRHLTLTELQAELKKDYQVFHFTGHGGHNGILMESEHGFAVHADPDWLKRHLRKHDLRLAVLNSCDTAKTEIDPESLTLSDQFVDLFHDLNVPFTIGMQFSIQQKAGNTFMQTFYQSLLAGTSFLESVQKARYHMVSEKYSFPIWQFMIPVTYVHPDMAEQAYESWLFAFDSDESKEIVPFEPDLPKIFSYRRNEQFAGRCKELTDSLKMLDPNYDKKILMLHGEGGMGKTALAIELAHRTARWYPYVWWTSGRKNALDSRLAGTLEDRESLNPVRNDAELFFKLATEIGVESKEKSITNVIRSIHEKLKNSPPSLLILDNMEHFNDMANLHHLLHGLPENCKAVLTSRKDIQEEKHLSEHIPIRKMLPKDSFRLIYTIAEELQLYAWWEHYGKINEVSKGHAQTIQMLTRQLDNNDPKKRKFFEWIALFEKQAEEGESLFLYVFDRKLDDISPEELYILFALSLFDDPVPAEAVYFVCKQDIPSFDLFRDLLKRLAGYRFVETFEDDEYTLQALADYIVRHRFKTHKQTGIAYRKKLIRYWQEKNDSQAEAEEYYRLAYLQNEYDEWYEALESLEPAEKIWETLTAYRQTAQVMNLSKCANLKGMLLLETGQWDKSIEFFEKSLQIQTDRQGMAITLMNLGVVYYRKGEWDKAIGFFEESLQTQTALEGRQRMANTLMGLGTVYRQKGEWDEAIRFYEKSLKIQTALGDRQGMANSYGNLGNVYQQKGEWDKAIEFYEKSLQIQTVLKDRQGMAKTFMNLGTVYRQKSEWDKAIEFYEKSLQIQTALGDQHGMANNLMNLGTVYLQKGEWDKAIGFFEESLQIQTALGDRQGMASVMGNLGTVYLKKGETLKGIDLWEKCLSIKREVGEMFVIMQAQITLASVYLKAGQNEKALSYLDEVEPLAIRFQHKQYLEGIQQLRKTEQARRIIMQILTEVAGEEAMKKGLKLVLEEIMTSPEKKIELTQKLAEAGINVG